MAPLVRSNCRRVALVLLLCVAVVFVGSFVFLRASAGSESSVQSEQFLLGAARRRLMEVRKAEEDDDDQIIVAKKKAKPTALATSEKSKNQTKLAKSAFSAKNQTKLMKPKSNLSSKNQTEPLKPTNSTKKASPASTIADKSELKKFNSTLKVEKLNTTSKAFNSTKGAVSSAKKGSDLGKLTPPKNKTKESQLQLDKKLTQSDPKKQSKNRGSTDQEPKTPPKTQKPKQPNWLDSEEDDDLVAEFRDLPTKFQQTLIPDLERISTTSKAYLTQANKQMTKGFKPYVGNKYAPTIATLVSCAFILIPLALVSLVFNRIQAYFSLQKLLIFVQVYLSIYFSILCLSSLATGLEPLRFFYATSRSTYVCIQIFQTLGYVLYLLLLLMYLVLVFSTDTGLGSKFLGLAQTFVGFAVGLHYYVAVFHRIVLHQPPRTNWKVHGVYAACFLAICLLARAERRKKAYLEEGGEEGKKS